MNDSPGYRIRDQFACHFLTFTTVGWVDIFTRKECKDILIQGLKYCIEHKGMKIHAYVIMPSHIHLIASASTASKGLSAIIRDFKRHTSKEIIKWTISSNKESRSKWMLDIFQYYGKKNSRNKYYQIWQNGSRPKVLLHPKFTRQKLAYIHLNPVKDGIVFEAEEYVYSSARNYAGMEACLMDVEILDFGVEEGYVIS